MTSKELLRLLKALDKNNIVEFRQGDLQIVRGNPIKDSPVTHKALTPKDLESEKRIEVEAILKEELSVKDDQLSMLQLEDPLGFERLLVEGELVSDERIKN